jgi:uncharacterized protein YbcI
MNNMKKSTKCYQCESELDKIIVGLNKKLLGRKILRFYCKICLSNYLEITVEDLLDMVETFKSQGCTLFD